MPSNRPDFIRFPFLLVALAAGAVGQAIQSTRPASSPVATSGSQPATAAATTFAGTWETTYGTMTLTLDGVSASGIYGEPGEEPATICGQVEGRRLTFRYVEAGADGEGSFDLTADGRSFEGRWRVSDETEWKPWRGKRIDPAAARAGMTISDAGTDRWQGKVSIPEGGPTTAAEAIRKAELLHKANSTDGPTAEERLHARATFDGLWKTSYGPMRLVTEGDRVTGCYSWNGVAEISGTRDLGGALRFNYVQPDGEKGSGMFRLQPGGDAFIGSWQRDGQPQGAESGAWTGQRNRPVPGRVWLVVLEANWESSLAEPEYSYGQMLRSFFTRLPNVQVRHRFIHSAGDFKRWAAEAGFFAEPVVLYVSSHGSPEGLKIGGDTVGKDELIASLKHVGELRLLHFGSCEVLSGDIPKQIMAAMPARERFPISGFTKTADWAGSAIVDFTYLELVLGRNMPPGWAAETTKRLIKFADEEADGAIAGSGLKIVEPSAVAR